MFKKVIIALIVLIMLAWLTYPAWGAMEEPTGRRVRWISKTAVEVTWTQKSDATHVFLSKNTPSSWIALEEYPGAFDLKFIITWPKKTGPNDAAYFPRPGETYIIRECHHNGSVWDWCTTWIVGETGPIPEYFYVMYFPAFFAARSEPAQP